ncbi:putative Zinc finger, C3HC [Helianthus debilis subsp. tardiflorus]
MREEGISSSGDPLLFRNSSSRPPTPAASSAGASSPAVATNAGSTDWLGHGQGSKVGSLSRIGSQPMWISLSASVGGSALGSSQPSCRPWERGDLLRRLSTFKPANWFGKPKAASSLACARRGWVNVDVDKIECESCCATLKYVAPDSWTPTKGGNVGEEFGNQLDEGHKVICPWRGNSCAESLVQFPPTPPSALIGGYKDRCDGLFQFLYLPIVAASTLDQMRVSRGPEIDRFLVQSHTFATGESGFKADIASGSDNAREEALCIYSRAQKLISLCGWEPTWVRNVQDCEENSAQSARNGCSFSPITDCAPPEDRHPNKKQLSASTKKGLDKNEQFRGRSPLLECSLCGATVRILNFLTVNRPARFATNINDVPETSKKMALTRGVSAASGINGWVGTDPMEKDQNDLDEAATTGEGKSMSNIGVDLDLTMGGGFSGGHTQKTVVPEQYEDVNIGKDLIIGQPTSSEVGDRAASYESRGPSTRKRNLDEGGSTSTHPSLSCNAVLCSGIEASKDEVTQAGKSSPTDECGFTNYTVANGIGPPTGESNFDEAVEFDPIKHHNFFCPWVNGNVAAAGVTKSNGSSSSASALALCGWQLTLDALDGFQTLDPNQPVESESAASLYKVFWMIVKFPVESEWHNNLSAGAMANSHACIL